MSDQYKRKKDPVQVRQALLNGAASLAVEEGLASVSVQAVSAFAGVTKGGFFHHFPTKQALIDAVFQDMLDGLDSQLDELMAADPHPHGRFTRAYTELVFTMKDYHGAHWPALCLSMVTDTQLRERWTGWFSDRLIQHADTDDFLHLESVRLAADGIWLGMISQRPLSDREALRKLLIQATLPRD